MVSHHHLTLENFIKEIASNISPEELYSYAHNLQKVSDYRKRLIENFPEALQSEDTKEDARFEFHRVNDYLVSKGFSSCPIPEELEKGESNQFERDLKWIEGLIQEDKLLDTVCHQFEYLLYLGNPAKCNESENGEPLGYSYFFENEYTDRRFIPQALHVLLTYDKPLDGIRIKIVRLITAIKRIHELDSLGNLSTDLICQLAYDVIAQNYEFIGSVKDYTLYDLYQAQLSELCKQICCDRERVTINY